MIIKNKSPFDLIFAARHKKYAFWDKKAPLSQVYYFIKGYELGLYSTGVSADEKLYKFNGVPGCNFQAFVTKKVDIKTNLPWYNVIEFLSPSLDDAIDYFYDLLDEFFEEE